MNIIEQVNEYKAKVEALAGKAAQAETAIADLEAVKAEKQSITEALVSKEAELTEVQTKVAELENEVTALKADIQKREDEKKAADEKALEIVANLGLKEIPVVTITETNKPSADQIRKHYGSLEGKEKAEYYEQNKKALLTGIVD